MRYSHWFPVTLFSFILALCCAPSAIFAARPTDNGSFYIHNGDKVVFYGDSITDGEWYPTLVETFVLTRYPHWRNQFFNRGVSGDNTRSISRFERDVVAQHPQLCTFMMGYNDGGYQKLKAETLSSFLGNTEQSVALARKDNPKIHMVLVAPTLNETTVSDDPRWVSPDVYPYTLLMLGQEEGKLASRLQTSFVDMGMLYGQTMGLGRVAAGSSFALSRDGVHPQQEGQTLIAYHLLRGIGADSSLANVEIDAHAGKVVQTAHCTVTKLAVQNGAISFTRRCDSLPYPTPEVARPFSFLVKLDDTLNQDRLVVRGLAAQSYVLTIDDQRIAEISAAALSDGVNLSAYTNTPMYAQALTVMSAVRQKQQLECLYWRQYITSGKADGSGAPLPSLDAAIRAEIEAARKKVSEAIAACYAQNLPRPHTITLTPSETKLSKYDALVGNDLNQAYLNVTQQPVKVNWNTMELLDHTMTVTLTNANTSAKTGTVHWNSSAGWRITPVDASFTIEPGKNLMLPFTVSCQPGTALLPLPVMAVRWKWTRDWAYAQTLNRELALAPVLTIKHTTKPITIDGNLEKWTNVPSFTLDDIHYFDPPVAGKKALWDGPADLSVKMMMQWDEQALYLAAVVRDSEHVQNAEPGMMWSQDMIHIAACLRQQGKPDGYYEYGFGAYANKDDVRDAVVAFKKPPVSDATARIQFKSHLEQTKGVCSYEIAIPWDCLSPFTATAGKSFRFTFAVGDAKSQLGRGYNFMEWTPGIAYGKNPNDFATIVLGGNG